MITWFKKLLWDETAFVRYARALLLATASAWTTYQVNGVLEWEMLVGSVVLGLAGLLGAGDKNPDEGGA